VKHFHEVLAGTVHECSLTSRIGRVRGVQSEMNTSTETHLAP
jgi:hypothetical protein